MAPRGRWLTALLAAAALAAFVGPSALAAPNERGTTSPVTVDGFTYAIADFAAGNGGPYTGGVAICARPNRKKQILGGGAEAIGAYDDDQLNQVAPNANENGWVGFVEHYSGTAGARLYSVCGLTGGKVKTALDGYRTTGGFNLSVSCPRRSSVTSGGLSNGGESSVTVRRSVPIDGDDRDRIPDDGWRASGFFDDENYLDVYAVCVPRDTYELSYRRETADLKPGVRSSLTAACPDRKHVVGGGGVVGTADAAITGFSLVDRADRDKAPDDGYRIEADGFRPRLAKGISAYAVCAS